MTARFLPAFSVLGLSVLTGLSLMSGTAFAQTVELQATQSIVKTITEKNDEANAQKDLMNQSVKDGLEQGLDKVNNVLMGIRSAEVKEQITPAPIYEISQALTALPYAYALTSGIEDAVMYNRLRELNRVKIDNIADYLVDTSGQKASDGGTMRYDYEGQVFNIFMRYFCDPQSRAITSSEKPKEDDTLGEKSFAQKGMWVKSKRVNYMLGCGQTNDSSEATRKTLLGADYNTSNEANQIISLPLRPEVLFLDPVTFPVQVSSNNTSTGIANDNPMATMYYAAVAQSMQFMLGSAPASVKGGNISGKPGAYINAQADVARMMLASKPFAILFSERMGTINEEAAKSVASMIESKMGSATADNVIYNRVEALKAKPLLSVAEYKDLVMHELMLSPGYYDRINSQLTPTQLDRELVWLTSLQTALAYERNRWQEMSTAIDAVRK